MRGGGGGRTHARRQAIPLVHGDRDRPHPAARQASLLRRPPPKRRRPSNVAIHLLRSNNGAREEIPRRRPTFSSHRNEHHQVLRRVVRPRDPGRRRVRQSTTASTVNEHLSAPMINRRYRQATDDSRQRPRMTTVTVVLTVVPDYKPSVPADRHSTTASSRPPTNRRYRHSTRASR